MVLMVLDHTRDFFFGGTQAHRSDEDVAHALLHALDHPSLRAGLSPSAGLAVFLAMERATDDAARSARRRFVFKRGVYLVLLEITVVRLGLGT